MAFRVTANSTYLKRTTGGFYSTGSMSVIFWAKMIQDRNTGVCGWLIADTVQGWYIAWYNASGDGTQMLWEQDGPAQLDSFAMTLDTWYCLALTRAGTGSNQTIAYRRTASQNSWTTATGTFGNPNHTLTSEVWGNNDFSLTTGWFPGPLAALKQWDAVLSADELLRESYQYLPIRYTNLYSFYPAKDLTVANCALDYSGNARNFTVTGTPVIDDGPPIPWALERSRSSVLTAAVEQFMIGTSTIDFGSFPGKSDTSLAITGQTTIAADSKVEAWIRLDATSDHSADEHLVDPPLVYAGNIVAGTGFTIYAIARDGIPVPDAINRRTDGGGFGGPVIPDQEYGRRAPMPYGQWKVDWAWA